ncbi:MAG: hypothetical protein GEV13_00960 [Rhodospirillales bacterium]|nr:hypothetical protein [Rhodospirillales bacterium]
MKVLFLGAALCLVCSVAYAQTWQAQPRLMKERSVASCTDDGTERTMIVSGNKLTMKTVVSYDATIRADGTVDEIIRLPSGRRLRLTGNVQTRDLELTNEQYGCRYKLVVKQ